MLIHLRLKADVQLIVHGDPFLYAVIEMILNSESKDLKMPDARYDPICPTLIGLQLGTIIIHGEAIVVQP